MARIPVIAGSAVALLLLSACGGGGGDESSSAAASAPASAAAAADGAISSHLDAQQAVIQIVADGDYVPIGEGQAVQTSGAGSGFIIDPSGIAVTNAHVVEGAGSIEVFIGGDDKPVNARILGVSECNDLAVIDLEDDSYPFLAWNTDEPQVGTEVWAAGFPLGDPQYTLVDGSLAKNNADGDTGWASLDYSLQSTAQIQPGNSGGPLITQDGRVVGVNYMSADVTNTTQFFAIPAALAKEVVDVLQTGSDQESIGINGEAFYDEAAALAGVWVSGVRSGSPASNAGIEAGDVILQMEGRDVVKSQDVDEFGATKAGYCDVLRTKGADSPIKIQIFRPTTGEVLEGEVNNPAKPLVPISSVSTGTNTETDTSTTTDADSAGFTLITDDTGSMSAEMPVEWAEVLTDPGEDYARIVAAPVMADFSDGVGVGLEYFLVDGALSADEMAADLADLESADAYANIISTCEESELGEVSEGDGYLFIGNSYWSCQGTDMSFFVSLRVYPDQDKRVYLDAQFYSDLDVEYINRSLGSLTIL